MVKTSQGLRFFSGFGKKKRLQTAWCLSGAKFFMHHDDIAAVVLELRSRKIVVDVHLVESFSLPQITKEFSEFPSSGEF